MFNKLTRPSLAFLLLLLSLVCAVFFVRWAVFEPFSFEKARMLENEGHKSWAAKKYDAAYKYFLASAGIQDSAVAVSRRYRCAASSAFALGDVRNGVRLSSQALRFDANNTLARQSILTGLASGLIRMELVEKIDGNILDSLFADTRVIYLNRTSDGWSKGKKSTALVYVPQECKTTVELLTSMPSRKGIQAHLTVDGVSRPGILLRAGKKYSTSFIVSKGLHEVDVETTQAFVPKEYNMNNDTRLLGVNYTVIITCDE
jgi:hypothetical protein